MFQKNINTRILIIVLLINGKAHANFNMHTFSTTSNFTYTFLEDSLTSQYLTKDIKTNSSIFFGAQYSTINTPIIQLDAIGNKTHNIVDRLSVIDLNMSILLANKWRLGGGLGIGEIRSFNSKDYGPTDTYLQLEHEIYNKLEDLIGLSISALAFFPTGTSKSFLSNNSLTGGALIALEKEFNKFSTTFNLGYIHSEKATYRNTDYSSQIRLGLGTHIPMTKKISANAEAFTSVLPNNENSFSYGEFYIGGQYLVMHNANLNFGLSLAGIDKSDSSNLRFVIGLKFMPLLQETIKSNDKNIIQIVKNIQTCSPEKNYQIFTARHLTSQEIALNSQLPYRSTSKQNFDIKKINQHTKLINGIPSNNNSQVLFAMDIKNLPTESSLLSVDSALLKIKISKNNISYHKEIFCILNNKLCTGEFRNREEWKENINDQFSEGKETPNDYFTRMLWKDIKIKQTKNEDIVVSNLTIDLKKVIENSLISSVKDIFYKNNSNVSTLYFLLAENIYVFDKPQLEIVTTIDACKNKKEKQ